MLERAIANYRLSSSYLFRGPSGVGKFAAAIEMVRWLKCKSPEDCDGGCHSCRLIKRFDHPDILIVLPMPRAISDSPDKTSELMEEVASDPFAEMSFERASSIGIDAIRGLSEELALAPTSPGGRWAIIRDADAMTIEASNAFLKTLEEPPEDVHIILTSSRPDYLLPTILSRTQPLRFSRLSRETIEEFLVVRGVEREKAALKAIAADGSINKALKYSEDALVEVRKMGERLWVALFSLSDDMALEIVNDLGRDKDFGRAVIESTISYLRDQLLYQKGLGGIVCNFESKDRLERASLKFSDPEPISAAMKLLFDKLVALDANPQYELFWMSLIIQGRNIIRDSKVQRM